MKYFRVTRTWYLKAFDAQDAVLRARTGYEQETIASQVSTREAMEHGIEPDDILPRAFVFVEGGVVNNIVADRPLDIQVIDYDTEGVPDDEIDLILDGEPAMLGESCRTVNVLPERVDKIELAILEKEEEKALKKEGLE